MNSLDTRRTRTPTLFCLDNLLFAVMQLFFWAGFGTLVVFIVSYLAELGYSSIQIGYVRSAGAVGAISGGLLWGTVADKSRRVDFVALAILITGISLFPLFSLTEQFLPTMIIFTVVAFFLFPMPALIDSWTTQMIRLNPAINYGATRAMGSLGFGCVVIFAGRAFDTYGISYLFPVYATLLSFVLPVIIVQILRTQRPLSALSIPRSPSRHSAAPPRSLATQGAHRIFNRPFTTFLLIAAVLMPCFTATLTFMPWLMNAIGGTNRHVGLAFSIMAMSEIPFMIFSAILLRRFRDTHIIAVACVFFFLRVISFVFVRTPLSLAMVHLFQGASFGLFLPAAISLCTRITPRSHRTRGLAILSFVFFDISSIVSGLAGGWLISVYDVRTMYAITSVAIAIPILSYWWLFVMKNAVSTRGARRVAARQ